MIICHSYGPVQYGVHLEEPTLPAESPLRACLEEGRLLLAGRDLEAPYSYGSLLHIHYDAFTIPCDLRWKILEGRGRKSTFDPG